jgi:hypothetical protein
MPYFYKQTDKDKELINELGLKIQHFDKVDMSIGHKKMLYEAKLVLNTKIIEQQNTNDNIEIQLNDLHKLSQDIFEYNNNDLLNKINDGMIFCKENILTNSCINSVIDLSYISKKYIEDLSKSNKVTMYIINDKLEEFSKNKYDSKDINDSLKKLKKSIK